MLPNRFARPLAAFSVAGFLAAGLACAAPQAAPAPKAPVTEDEKAIYALGLMLGRNVAAFELTPDEVAVVQQAIADVAAGRKPAVDPETYQAKLRELAEARGAKRAEREKAAGKTWVESELKQGGTKADSGLVYRETQAGTGDSPKATDTVKVHYRGTLVDGTEFDSSYKRDEPTEFPLNRVIPCWTEGLQKMKPGGKATLFCPSDIAYGDHGRPGIPPGATLKFEIELLSVTPAGAPPAAPAKQ